MEKNIKIKSYKYPHIPHLEFEGKLLNETPHYFFVECEKNTVLHHFINKDKYVINERSLHFFSKYHGYTVSIAVDDNYVPVRTFCNISTPCGTDEDGDITYIDLDMDYVKNDKGLWFLRNHEMFMKNSEQYSYPFQLSNFALVSLQELKNNITKDVFPFGITNFRDVDGPIR